MSETRRQVFKTSILSAFGLMTVPVVAACSPQGFGLSANNGPADAQIPIVGYGHGNWYIIVFDDTKNGYVVYKAMQEPPSDPAVRPFDTAQWFASLYPKDVKPVTTCYIDGVGGLAFDGDILSSPSVGVVQNAARTKWSEIGAK
jgi:hypothetical protein